MNSQIFVKTSDGTLIVEYDPNATYQQIYDIMRAKGYSPDGFLVYGGLKIKPEESLSNDPRLKDRLMYIGERLFYPTKEEEVGAIELKIYNLNHSQTIRRKRIERLKDELEIEIELERKTEIELEDLVKRLEEIKAR